MKRKIIILFIVLLTASSSIYARGKGGIGVAAGDPAGLSLRFDKIAIQAGFSGWGWGWGWGGYRLITTVDYLFLNQAFNNQIPLYWYIGAGPFVGLYFSHGFNLGARVPFGLQYFIDSAKIELYIEVAPGIHIFPGPGFDLMSSLGIRFLIF
ncbi:MAG: hypothetical protein OEV78_08115 [Spirochaetia bacterium]|nr:hypothetical protein [Spirochaetia bacterium]